MSDTVIRIENLSKQYRLGLVSTGTLSHDLNRFWHKIRGKEDPYLKIGETNDRSTKGESDYVWALRDINLEVKRGERIGIIGKNGAGKSTLLKILSEVTGPTQGTIKMKGRTGSLLEVGTGFHPELTGRENIYMNGTILGMSRSEVTKKLDEIVDFAGVERYLDTPVKRYSSGMKVRLGFAVAAHLEPDILIVDEVLAVGDAEFQKKAIGKMQEVSEGHGRTILFVSHNMGSISSLCEKTILMNNGGIEMADNTEKVLSHYLNPHKEMVPEKFISGDMRVRGNGNINFTTCFIADVNNLKKNSFLINEDIKISVELQSQYQGEIGFWIIIKDINDNPILCSHQKDVSKLNISQGKFRMEYITNGISLLPGEYKIALGVLDYQYTTFFEWVENCLYFKILPAFMSGLSYDGRLGLVIQDAKWNCIRL